MTHEPSDDAPHIETTPDERLVYMANQIARFFAAQTHDEAVKGVADHIAKYWDPRMRQRIRAHLTAGGAGLSPLAQEAIATLTR